MAHRRNIQFLSHTLSNLLRMVVFNKKGQIYFQFLWRAVTYLIGTQILLKQCGQKKLRHDYSYWQKIQGGQGGGRAFGEQIKT